VLGRERDREREREERETWQLNSREGMADYGSDGGQSGRRGPGGQGEVGNKTKQKTTTKQK